MLFIKKGNSEKKNKNNSPIEGEGRSGGVRRKRERERGFENGVSLMDALISRLATPPIRKAK
jgi:hypothetical protein